MPPWTTLAVLDWTTQRFQTAAIEGARLEAQLLLAHTLSCQRIELYTNFDRPMSEAELARYRELIRRRLAGEPLAYLLGEHEFWALPFWVDASVLVPRADTETLIEVVLARRDAAAPGRLLDLCTGSGAIAISLLHSAPALTGVATDVSQPALTVAARNAERNGVASRLELRHGDLWDAVAGQRFDLIVANPPYIATAVIATLAAEVRQEPRLALDGGVDGLAFYDRIVARARDHLTPGGWIFLEHGFDQAAAVTSRLAAAGFIELATAHDLGKNPRVTFGRAPPSPEPQAP